MDSTEDTRDDDATSDDGVIVPAAQAEADRPTEPAHPTDRAPDRKPEAPGSGLGPGWQPA